MLLIVYVTSLLLKVLLFCHEAEAAVTEFTSKPSNPTFVLEGQDVTVEWRYTLDGEVGSATFNNVTGAVKVEMGKRFSAGNMTLNQARFSAVVLNTQAQLRIRAVQISDQGKYEFIIFATGVGNLGDVVEVIVQSPANFTNVSGDYNVTEGSDLQLFCQASGKPAPNITWVQVLQDGSESEVLHRGPTWNFLNINRIKAGTYRCTAYNGAGDPARHKLTVNVLFSPRINLQDTYYVNRGQAVSLHCRVEGYPPPTITWTPCNPQERACGNSFLNITNVQMSAEIYTCAAENSLNKTSATTNLFIGGKVIYLRMTITSEKCAEGKYDKLKEAVDKLFKNMNDYNETALLKVSFPVVYLSVEFRTMVTEDWVLSVIRNATQGGTLKEFCVNASSIVGIAPITQTTTKAPVSRTTPKSDGNKTAIIVGAVVGSLAVVAIIVAVVIWFVYKKKKQQGKGTKEVGDDQAAGQGKSGAPASAAHGLNNSGYINAGSASGYANPSGLPAAKPLSKKETKQEKGKKQKETNEQQALPLYAQVDKSKKTPKPPLNTYDQVERSRKSQPGEVMYTQVEQVNPGGSMPRAAASPVRRPPAYDDTQYAELII